MHFKNAVSREPTVGPRTKGTTVDRSSYCCRQTPSRQLATDEINLSNVHYNAKVSRLNTSQPVKPGSTRFKFITNFATLIWMYICAYIIA